jgi:hypothetical protein
MSKISRHEVSRHDEPPLVNQEAHPFNYQLTRKGLLPVHEVANEDKEHDEDVEVHRRREEEVVCEEQEGLGAIPALDGSDDPGCLQGCSAVCRDLEGDDLGEKGHPGERRYGGVISLESTWGCGDGVVE